MTDISTRVVSTPAPALSFAVIVFVLKAGFDLPDPLPPAPALPRLVPPVLLVTGV